ncbi:sulfurtransferase [Paenibacillus sp. CN-4]|uniref:sulfurtransferase n=1 Tax=Paenibacillus nanchangensis TaxID=3348343 RepID=UPI00397A768A
MDFTVQKRWLLARLFEPDLVIVDCRFWLEDPEAGKSWYEESHLPRAVYLDLKRDLSDPPAAHGGRHPLPSVERMAAVFGRAGIRRDSRVVVYDDNEGMNAARVWWMLTYLGHEQVYVLEQGFSAWKDAGYPVTSDQPVVIPTNYEVTVAAEHLRVDVERVREVSASLSGAESGAGSDVGPGAGSGDRPADSPAQPIVLIDSRSRERYEGRGETLDPVAGHIPGAVNFFWKEVLEEDGSFKSAEQLREHFAGIDLASEIIVYCGSGVTACPNVLALRKAGFANVKLYPGSWSDWISYPENPVVTGKEEDQKEV